jgi:hypothetical protein
MSGARTIAQRLARIEPQLGERDQLVVGALDRVRVATTVQLHRLLVVGPEPSTLRRTQALLARLVRLGVVTRLERRVGGVRSGSAGQVYALDTLGQRLASACGPAGGRRLRRPWTPGLLFVTHQLGVAEVYVGLREAERAGALSLLDFDAEPLSWRSFAGLGGARTILKPDSYVRLGLGQFEDRYFIEVDQATESLPALARKLTVYRRYYATGREQGRTGAFPAVLFLVPSESRRDAVAALIAKQSAEVQRFAAVALASDAPHLFTREVA